MKLPIALFVLGVTLCSCATITRGTTQAFTITSEPTGADIRLWNGPAYGRGLTGTKRVLPLWHLWTTIHT